MPDPTRQAIASVINQYSHNKNITLKDAIDAILEATNEPTMYDYQQGCLDTWGGANKEIRAFLALAEEAGEAVGKYQKYLRSDYSRPEMIEKVKLELGDVLFYVAVTAYELDLSLSDIAEANRKKLQDRKQRGVICGSGDER